VQAELIAHAPEGLGPGKLAWLGLRAHQKDWHTYWKNPGDSGLPTELRWELPPRCGRGRLARSAPVPHRPTGQLRL
jgi:thiol:disulfide interchange protein DsbD